MARPEGYRKAVRLMETADRFGLPVIATATLGTPSAKQASVERAMASAWPRSSASMPG
jgi:acetyl-CoA carboxylase carboxyl transferase subunit alpha